jgi:hypothetical protein
MQRNPRTAHFVWVGAIKDNIAVVWDIVVAKMHLIHGHVMRAADPAKRFVRKKD